MFASVGISFGSDTCLVAVSSVPKNSVLGEKGQTAADTTFNKITSNSSSKIGFGDIIANADGERTSAAYVTYMSDSRADAASPESQSPAEGKKNKGSNEGEAQNPKEDDSSCFYYDDVLCGFQAKSAAVKKPRNTVSNIVALSSVETAVNNCGQFRFTCEVEEEEESGLITLPSAVPEPDEEDVSQLEKKREMLTAAEVITTFLRFVKTDVVEAATTSSSITVLSVVITVPRYADTDVIHQCALQAGFCSGEGSGTGEDMRVIYNDCAILMSMGFGVSGDITGIGGSSQPASPTSPNAASPTGAGQSLSNSGGGMLVLDWGANSLTISLVDMSSGSLSLVAQKVKNGACGGKQLDKALSGLLADQFKKKTRGMDPTDNSRSMRKLLLASESMKKTLTASTTTQVDIEAFFEGMDLNDQFSRMKLDMCFRDKGFAQHPLELLVELLESLQEEEREEEEERKDQGQSRHRYSGFIKGIVICGGMCRVQIAMVCVLQALDAILLSSASNNPAAATKYAHLRHLFCPVSPSVTSFSMAASVGSPAGKQSTPTNPATPDFPTPISSSSGLFSIFMHTSVSNASAAGGTFRNSLYPADEMVAHGACAQASIMTRLNPSLLLLRTLQQQKNLTEKQKSEITTKIEGIERKKATAVMHAAQLSSIASVRSTLYLLLAPERNRGSLFKATCTTEKSKITESLLKSGKVKAGQLEALTQDAETILCYEHQNGIAEEELIISSCMVPLVPSGHVLPATIPLEIPLSSSSAMTFTVVELLGSAGDKTYVSVVFSKEVGPVDNDDESRTFLLSVSADADISLECKPNDDEDVPERGARGWKAV